MADDERHRRGQRGLCEITGFEREELIGAKLPFPFFAAGGAWRGMLRFMREMRATGRGEIEVDADAQGRLTLRRRW